MSKEWVVRAESHARLDPKAERLRDFAAVAKADGRPAMSDQLRAIADEVERQAEQVQHDALVILGLEADLDHAEAKAQAARADALAEKLERVTAQRDALLTAIDELHAARDAFSTHRYDRALEGLWDVRLAARDAVKERWTEYYKRAKLMKLGQDAERNRAERAEAQRDALLDAINTHRTSDSSWETDERLYAAARDAVNTDPA